MNPNWRVTVNGLSWDQLPNQSFSIEANGRRASIVRLEPAEALCTLIHASGVAEARWVFGVDQFENTKARIVRFLGAAE